MEERGDMYCCAAQKSEGNSSRGIADVDAVYIRNRRSRGKMSAIGMLTIENSTATFRTFPRR
jgi:hypothetical protein